LERNNAFIAKASYLLNSLVRASEVGVENRPTAAPAKVNGTGTLERVGRPQLGTGLKILRGGRVYIDCTSLNEDTKLKRQVMGLSQMKSSSRYTTHPFVFGVKRRLLKKIGRWSISLSYVLAVSIQRIM